MELIRVVRGTQEWKYPAFQSRGFASKFAFPFADEVCFGNGLDIGFSKPEWKLPSTGARTVFGIEPDINPDHDAMNLPDSTFRADGKWDFIFSSHCLEHVKESWGVVLNYWKSKLKEGGILFLYLPGPGQQYWKNWSNTKHVHNFEPHQLKEYFDQNKYLHSFVSGEDLNNSFYAVGQL